MEREKKFFGDPNSGLLNADDAPFSLGENQWINSENFRTGSTDKGQINTGEGIGSTELISTPQPSVTFLQIGSVEDTESGMVCSFFYNVHGPWHKIEAYFPATNTIYTVLLSSQITGGLNFSKNFPIHSARIVDGKLYWVEGTNNQPRKINIYSGIKMNHPSFDTDEIAYVAPLSQFEITIIKPPPSYPPNIQKAVDAGFVNNFIGNDSFEFSYQFGYYDNETTVIGTYSPASRLNSTVESENYISVVMDALQQIPQTVRIVNLIVRQSNTNFANIVKTWDKNNADDALEISNQNANISLLTYNFYNNTTGAAVPNAPVNQVLKAFDSVPIYSWALETAKNRLLLGNNISGYDTPTTTSLQLSFTTIDLDDSDSVTKNLLEVRAKVGVPGDDNDFAYGAWYVYLSATDGVTAGYYLLNGTVKTSTFFVVFWQTMPALDPPPTTTSLAGLTYAGATQADLFNFITTGPPNVLEGSAIFTRSNIITVTGLTVAVNSIFKTRSPYKAGVVFYDFAMRKCGVVTNDGLLFEIPSRDFNFTSATNGVIWSLSNANAINEIPDWAYYYAVVRTLNLRTRFFIQSFDNAVKYATKDAEGAYVYTQTTYNQSAVGIAINTTALVQSGLGYSFTQGDIAVIIDENDNLYELPVIAQDGNYIIVKAQDIGDTANLEIIYEVYTPYQTSEQEPFFEVGQLYQILDPGSSARRYDVTTDVFSPDIYAISRNYDASTYFAEGMSPNDLFFQRWDTDAGKPNFITVLGQVQKKIFLNWSNTFIPGTSVNGLSTFDALDETSVPEDCGAIQKLILTSKVQGEGTVMLCICTVETNSIYLGESQLYDTNGALIGNSGTSNFIGTINTLQGSFGTVNPESVVMYRGLVFWLDAGNGRIVQYSANGLFPISNYKMTRYWKLFCDQYLSMTREQIEALGGRPFVFSTVDPHHDELLFSVPKLLETPPKGYLPDNPSEVYPFDIWDGQGKTIVYKVDLGQGIPKWKGSFSFNPEGFITLQNKLYSFKNGLMYKHNSLTSYNNFYGVQYSTKVMFVSNYTNQIKVYHNISVEGNMCPVRAYLYNDYPYQQCTDLLDSDFKDLEGVFYATFYRNKLIPTASGYTTDGLLTGEKMRSAAMFCMLEFLPVNSPLELKFVNIGFTLSVGHKL